MKHYLLLSTTLLLSACASKQETPLDTDSIRINQVGYYTQHEKTASIESDCFADAYQLIHAETGQIVWEGPATRQATSPWSGKERQIVDFSSVTQPGRYYLQAGSYRKSLKIDEHPLRKLALGAMKAFYFQRTGETIKADCAGVWSRAAAHPDTAVQVHPSAASKQRPTGTRLSSPGGWYDAGDYNKYIVNSGFTTGLLLTAYQMLPKHFGEYQLNIPESSNDTPDMLDEILVNLRWMLTMQDTDGGVYHKLTTPNFEGFVTPTLCNQQRYVVQKGTAATLDFAAAMAQAARVYRAYPAYQDFAQQAEKAAIQAWRWANSHKNEVYNQTKINDLFDPDILTGEYGDHEFSDEFFWAATELYLTTGKRVYLNAASQYARQRDYQYTLPTWGNVNGLAAMAWLIGGTYGFSADTEFLFNKYEPQVLAYCNEYLAQVPTSCYQAPFGNQATDFGWGCLSENCCNRGITLLFAYHLTSNAQYLQGALQCADYLLGRNATGYSYVTGFGQKSPLNPHHRISATDNVEAPVPGLLVGGPNPLQQDHCAGYPSTQPDESYLDKTDSYASNEIAINWNASLAAFIGWLDADL